MKKLVVVMLVACGACGGGTGARPASGPPQQQRGPSVAEAQAATQQTALAWQAAQQRAIAEQVAAARARLDSQVAEASRRQELAESAQRARDDADAKRRDDHCAASRQVRADDAREWLSAYLDFRAKLRAHKSEIVKSCRIVTKKTGAVTVTRSGGGMRVAPELHDDVICAGGAPPKGFTMQQVYAVLWAEQPGVPADDMSEPVIDQGQSPHRADDDLCRASDLAVGLDTLVHRDDVEGMRKLANWKPPSAAVDAGSP